MEKGNRPKNKICPQGSSQMAETVWWWLG